MTDFAFTRFETCLGVAAIAWSDRGVVGVQLPERDAHTARRQMQRRFPRAHESPPSPEVARACAAIEALLRGEAADLTFVALDTTGISEFDQRVYVVARTIPPGATLSYGGVARRLGEPTQTREVGQALARNPFPIIVPCHRVLARGGRLGGFSAPGGVATKLRLLAIEGADAAGARSLFDAEAFGRG